MLVRQSGDVTQYLVSRKCCVIKAPKGVSTYHLPLFQDMSPSSYKPIKKPLTFMLAHLSPRRLQRRQFIDLRARLPAPVYEAPLHALTELLQLRRLLHAGAALQRLVVELGRGTAVPHLLVLLQYKTILFICTKTEKISKMYVKIKTVQKSAYNNLCQTAFGWASIEGNSLCQENLDVDFGIGV